MTSCLPLFVSRTKFCLFAAF